jgi:sugar phosphate isomerase/epimerase
MREPVVWIYSDATSLKKAKELAKNLEQKAKSLILAPKGVEQADLNLGDAPDLLLALEGCPPELRPRACALVAKKAPHGIDCLPCPVLGFEEVCALEGRLPEDPAQAADMISEMARQEFCPPWLENVQVNLPLRYLLNGYADLARNYPVNLEIGIDAEALDSLGATEVALARELLGDKRLTAHLPFKDLAPASNDPLISRAACERLAKAMDWAYELGAFQMVMHLGYDWRIHRELDQFAKNMRNNLTPLLDKALDRGMSLALENTFEPGPEVLLAVLESLGKPPGLGFCLDVGHALSFSRTSLEKWWQELKGHLMEMHLHDNMGEDDQHLPPGWGKADWKGLKSWLDDQKDLPVLTLEPHKEPYLWASLRGLLKLWGDPFGTGQWQQKRVK